MCSRISSVGQSRSRVSAVSTGPGEIALTRIPCAAHSTASVRVRLTTPAFAAAECTVPGACPRIACDDVDDLRVGAATRDHAACELARAVVGAVQHDADNCTPAVRRQLFGLN